MGILRRMFKRSEPAPTRPGASLTEVVGTLGGPVGLRVGAWVIRYDSGRVYLDYAGGRLHVALRPVGPAHAAYLVRTDRVMLPERIEIPLVVTGNESAIEAAGTVVASPDDQAAELRRRVRRAAAQGPATRDWADPAEANEIQ